MNFKLTGEPSSCNILPWTSGGMADARVLGARALRRESSSLSSSTTSTITKN